MENFGVYLISDMEEILLPRKYVPPGTAIGDRITVFVYRDAEDRTIATTLAPKARAGEFACLKVKTVTGFGAFLDWGLEKDLLVPRGEQPRPMIEGRHYVVRLFLDHATRRVIASAHVSRYLSDTPKGIERGQPIRFMVYAETDLGYLAIAENAYDALLYRQDAPTRLGIGDRGTAYVKQIRPNGTIVITLLKSLLKGAADHKHKILAPLKTAGGFLPLHDKSSPESIYKAFQMSKKTFKKTIGNLYREGKITITPNGIKLLHQRERSRGKRHKPS